MAQVVPDEPVELLIADNSHAHLDRVLVASNDGEAPGCGVDSPDECITSRRARTLVFGDSDEIDSCPMLRDRARGPCSAACVPVSILGRMVGVMHTTGPVGEPLDGDRVDALQTLANQAGNRLGMLRVMAETRTQASTDGLTGLVNRRNFVNELRSLRSEGTEFAFVMADLDHFKMVNDTHGHEIGDRALRVFSETVRQVLRTDDLACRYGGEEFAIALPRSGTADAINAVERMRDALQRVIERGGSHSCELRRRALVGCGGPRRPRAAGRPGARRSQARRAQPHVPRRSRATNRAHARRARVVAVPPASDGGCGAIATPCRNGCEYLPSPKAGGTACSDLVGRAGVRRSATDGSSGATAAPSCQAASNPVRVRASGRRCAIRRAG